MAVGGGDHAQGPLGREATIRRCAGGGQRIASRRDDGLGRPSYRGKGGRGVGAEVAGVRARGDRAARFQRAMRDGGRIPRALPWAVLPGTFGAGFGDEGRAMRHVKRCCMPVSDVGPMEIDESPQWSILELSPQRGTRSPSAHSCREKGMFPMTEICTSCRREPDDSWAPIPDRCRNKLEKRLGPCVGTGDLPGGTFNYCDGCSDHYDVCGKCGTSHKSDT